MPSLPPEQQRIAEAIRQVQTGISRGEVQVEGVGAMKRNALVHAVCHRIGVAYDDISGQVYAVLRLVEEEDGRSP